VQRPHQHAQKFRKSSSVVVEQLFPGGLFSEALFIFLKACSDLRLSTHITAIQEWKKVILIGEVRILADRAMMT
jgi:hypothetical protein